MRGQHAPDPAAMLTAIARALRSGGKVAIIEEVGHPFAWIGTEQADIPLGFTTGQIEKFSTQGHLVEHGHDALGMQKCVRSTTSIKVPVSIGTLVALARAPATP